MSGSESMGTLTSPAMSASLMRQSFRSSSGRRSSTRDPMGRPRSDGAEGGTRTPTGCPTRPSNVRVCQFRHFGAMRTRSIPLPRAADKPRGALPQARVERVADPLAQEIVREHGDEDREPWVEGQPPADLDRVFALVEDVAPGRVRWLDAEPEERQARLGEDRSRNAERHCHEHGRHLVSQDMEPDKPEAARTHRLRPDEELALLERKELRADEPRHA